MRRRYDPVFHNCIVENIKNAYKNRFNSELELTELEIFKVFEDCYLCEDSERITLETLRQTQKEKRNGN